MVAQLIIELKDGGRLYLFHSWKDIIISQQGITLLPELGENFNWDEVERIIVINTNSDNYLQADQTYFKDEEEN